MSKAYTTHGDDGYTSLIGPGRVPKYHPQPEAYGTVDETSAAMGLARALVRAEQVKGVLLHCQRHLYKLMAELAATPETASRLSHIRPDDVAWLAEQTDLFSARLNLPREFVVAGDTPASAALDLARTIARRAERLVVRLVHDGQVANVDTIRYLNRLSSLLFVLARYEDALSDNSGVTLVKEGDSQTDM